MTNINIENNKDLICNILEIEIFKYIRYSIFILKKGCRIKLLTYKVRER